MAQDKLSNRRQILKMSLLPSAITFQGCLASDRALPLALVFESPVSLIDLDQFDWTDVKPGRGLFRESGMYLSPRSPKEMAFMGEEIKGLPQWVDLSWLSPLLDPDDYGIKGSSERNKFMYSKAKRYKQRVEISSQVKAEDVQSLKPGRVLKLRFTFMDTVVKFDYFVQQWR
jgi:hypothetical protein